MAIPTVPMKGLMAAAYRKATTWNTPLAVGAGYGCDILGDGGLQRTRPYEPALSADAPMVLEGDLGLFNPVSFTPTFEWRYDPGGIGVMLAQLFGTAGTPSGPVNSAYTHTLQWADENYGEFGTFVVERVGKAYEVPGCKVVSATFGVSGGIIIGSIGLLGSYLTDASAVNGATQTDAITYDDRYNRVKFVHTIIWMNAQTDGALSGTGVECSDFTVSYERPHDSVHGANSNVMLEPVQNAHPVITVEMTFPRMNTTNAGYFATFNSDTEQKLLIQMTGAEIGSGQDYRYQLQFPRMRIVELDFPFGDVISGRMKLQAEEASAAPTGMAYARPYIVLKNTRSTNYLT